MSGRLETEKQVEKLQKFKASLEDVLTPQHDDNLLVKFLIARNFDLKKSESMFRKQLQWRRINKVDTILEDYTPPEILDLYYGNGMIGPNKEGYLTIVMQGALDFRGLLQCYKRSEIMKYNIYKMEYYEKRVTEYCKEIGRPDLDKFMAIYDAEGMGMKSLWKPRLDILREVTNMLEENYPETQKEMLIVNTPPVFQKLYSLVKHLFKRELRQKWKILGSNWKGELLTLVDADLLPAHYGGNATDPDGNPRCVTKIGTRDKVPECYYIKDQHSENVHLLTREMERGSALELKYEVTKGLAVLSYEFFTKTHDIAFGIKKLNDDGTKTVILKKQKYNCYLTPEDGTIDLTEVGTYVVKFDNRYSMLRPKSLSYWVELLQETDEDEQQQCGGADGEENLGGSAENTKL